jgi:rhamnulose-1-phosphate aldolase/alcohol dehydrogenase
MPLNQWSASDAAGLTGVDELVYRSNLLGRDRTVCNIYGGNTGMKTTGVDFRGRETRVLWVKGSGSDLATMKARDFAGLRLDEVLPLFERDAMADEDMTAYLGMCQIGPGMPRQSIETLLHAFVPAEHTDHTHPDAVIALACSPNGPAWMRRLWGARAAWVDYIRPGFALSKQIGAAVRADPKIEAVVMGKHGLVTWGADSRTCYATTLRIIQEAEDFLGEQAKGKRIFPVTRPALDPDQRQVLAAAVLPAIRGATSQQAHSIVLFDDTPDVLVFVGAEGAQAVASVGAACPDHLVHTKRVPLFVDGDLSDPAALAVRVKNEIAGYMRDYSAYFDAHKGPGDRMVNPAPRVLLIPGLGMFTTGKDAQNAQVAADLYHRAIAVMRGATALDAFQSLSAAEAYAIEYWPLELYKLTLKPPDRELAGRVAFVTGAASGIGRATAQRLAAEGAHVVIADLNLEGAEQVAAALRQQYGHKRGLAVACDVTDETQVVAALRQAVLAYGGVDIVVSNAGLASSRPIVETSLAEYDRLFDVLAKGYFLVSREAFKIWQAQGGGGSLVYVASKNGLIGSKNAAAYGAAKAAEINLARCLAEEGGAHGIRVNCVNPDAVLQGSGIWDAGWRDARAKGMGIAPDQLEEAYRQRTTLKRNVYPEDIAEAVFFFASERSAKTTGGILNVDGGLVAAYVR